MYLYPYIGTLELYYLKVRQVKPNGHYCILFIKALQHTVQDLVVLQPVLKMLSTMFECLTLNNPKIYYAIWRSKYFKVKISLLALKTKKSVQVSSLKYLGYRVVSTHDPGYVIFVKTMHPPFWCIYIMQARVNQ